MTKISTFHEMSLALALNCIFVETSTFQIEGESLHYSYFNGKVMLHTEIYFVWITAHAHRSLIHTSNSQCRSIWWEKLCEKKTRRTQEAVKQISDYVKIIYIVYIQWIRSRTVNLCFFYSLFARCWCTKQVQQSEIFIDFFYFARMIDICNCISSENRVWDTKESTK